MICEFLGLGQNWWSVAGLTTGFVGVALLGFDLVRLQRILRNHATANLNYFEDMASEYGGIEGWSEEIRKQAKWLPKDAYSDYCVDDEVSFNARKASDAIGELAACLNGLAEHVSKLMTLQNHQAQYDAATARTSFRFSVIGLAVVASGFALQIVGTLPC